MSGRASNRKRGSVGFTNVTQQTPVDSYNDNYKWKAFAAVAAGLFVTVMDFGMVGVALPTIARDFHLSLFGASWVSLASALTISAVLLPFGRVADIAGRRTAYSAGLAIFGAGAVMAALSPSIAVLVPARIVMALGSALVMANGMAIVTLVFPPTERGKGLGLVTTMVGVAAVIGPIVGGRMVDSLGWRSPFWLMTAGGLVSAALAYAVLIESRIASPGVKRGTRYDWAGAVLSAAGLSLLIVVMTTGGRLGWVSAPSLGGLALTALFLGAFIWWELRVRAPMFDLRAFGNPQFSWANATRFFGFLGGSAAWFLMPFYLQDVLGFRPATIGWIMVPGALFMALMGTFSGRWSDRFGVKPFTVTGLTLTAIAGLVFATLGADSSLWIVMPALALNGIGMGLWMAPNMSASIAAVPPSSYGVVTAFLNLVRNTASVIGIAAATVIVTAVIAGRGYEADLRLIGDDATGGMARAFVDGSRIAYIALAAFIVIGLAGAIRTRDPERTKGAAPDARVVPGVPAAGGQAVPVTPAAGPRLAGASSGPGASDSGGGTG
jgi:EmrB/QacA subfamily drug resistance transporter